MHGRFSGASSPWYKMMMSSNDEDDHLETNQSARKKKFLPKIKVLDKGTYIKMYSTYSKFLHRMILFYTKVANYLYMTFQATIEMEPCIRLTIAWRSIHVHLPHLHLDPGIQNHPLKLNL